MRVAMQLHRSIMSTRIKGVYWHAVVSVLPMTICSGFPNLQPSNTIS